MEINRTVYKDVSKGLKVKFELEALKTEQPVQIAEAELLSNSFLYSFKSSAETLKREKKITNYFQKQTKDSDASEEEFQYKYEDSNRGLTVSNQQHKDD